MDFNGSASDLCCDAVNFDTDLSLSGAYVGDCDTGIGLRLPGS